MKKKIVTLAAVLTVSLVSSLAHAGPPFINLEGAGGIAFNPLAYTAHTPGEEGFKLGPVEIAKPRIGGFYVNLNDSSPDGIDWTTAGIATAINKRVELSYGYESVNIGGTKNVHKSNIGTKVAILDENAFGTNYLPALSIGGSWKKTNFTPGKDVEDNGFDAYVVASKTITQTPIPVLVSGGVLSTRGKVNGIIGFNDSRKVVFFGNIDFVPTNWLAVGFEFKQGPDYGSYKDDDYYNLHAGWLVNKNLTLVAAYTNAGDRHSSTKVGFGGGPVISAQYAF